MDCKGESAERILHEGSLKMSIFNLQLSPRRLQLLLDISLLQGSSDFRIWFGEYFSRSFKSLDLRDGWVSPFSFWKHPLCTRSCLTKHNAASRRTAPLGTAEKCTSCYTVWISLGCEATFIELVCELCGKWESFAESGRVLPSLFFAFVRNFFMTLFH